MTTETKPMTWRELKEAVNQLPDKFLDAPVRWWGGERGGCVNKVRLLEEPYCKGDYDWQPVSVLDDDDDLEDYDVLEQGSPILDVG